MKRNIAITVICSLVCLSIFNNAYGNATIKGTFIGFPEGAITKVNVYQPIGNYYNSDYPTSFPLREGVFNSEITNNVPVFIQLQFLNKRIILFVEPNNQIAITATFNKEKKDFALTFSGDNNAGHIFYNNLRINEFRLSKTLVNSLLGQLEDNTAESIFAAFNLRTTALLSPLDSLYNLKLVSEQFYMHVKQNFKIGFSNTLLWELYDIRKRDVDKDTKYIVAQQLTKLIFSEYSPFQQPYSLYPESSGYVINYCKSWSMDNPHFNVPENWSVYGAYWNYNILPKAIRENELGMALMMQKMFLIHEFDYAKALNVYRDSFPKSAYLPILHEIENGKKVPDGQLKFVSPGSSTSRYGETVVDTNHHSSIKATLNLSNTTVAIDTVNCFNNLSDLITHIAKDDVVYMDLWATWCIPCLECFKDYPDLFPFLKKKGIKTLFISTDLPSAQKRWLDMTQNSGLYGYHIMANRSLYKDICKLVYQKGEIISIPRYIIINKGEIVNSNAPRPGDPKLKELLNKLLAEK